MNIYEGTVRQHETKLTWVQTNSVNSEPSLRPGRKIHGLYVSVLSINPTPSLNFIALGVSYGDLVMKADLSLRVGEHIRGSAALHGRTVINCERADVGRCPAWAEQPNSSSTKSQRLPQQLVPPIVPHSRRKRHKAHSDTSQGCPQSDPAHLFHTIHLNLSRKWMPSA